MMWLTVGLLLCITVPALTLEWCYHYHACNDTTWPTLYPQFCNGSRQSPIDIVTSNATVNSNLTAFNFTNFGNTSIFKTIKNTGQTIKVSFASGVQVSGGNLPETYDSLQFHLHWGNGSSVPGSEHTVDGKRYPMEFHIVSIKSSHNGNTTVAVADPEGVAALGILIDVDPTTTGKPDAWKTLTSYLSNITENGQSVNITHKFSLDDLMGNVDRTQYYRYLGSLTTPNCYEAVIWTVFKERLKVSKDLIDIFSKSVRIGNSTSDFMVNVYRDIQPWQPVTQTSSGSKMSCSYGLVVLIVALWMR